MTPDVSKAIGTEKWLGTRLPYKESFLSLAKAATAPALLVALAMYEGAKVSVQVESQTRSLPLFQGTTDIPSGRFSSSL